MPYLVSMGIGSPSGTSFSGGAISMDGNPGGGFEAVVVPVGGSVVAAADVDVVTPWYKFGACGPSLGSR
ncbi:hypothetical protein [Rhodococcus sp. JG-3]|uniref:hypothetical protein n=1 Tax=Rhodococcus sp. JG-3 TaxID=1305835 RepID=UPI0012695F93|nr:hypothetical protein [Rhodococcus sp. JG-3]